MRYIRFIFLLAVFSLLTLVGLSSRWESAEPPPARAEAPTAQLPAQPPGAAKLASNPAAARPAADVPDLLASASFANAAEIDNQYLPLRPGTQYVYDGFTQTAGLRISHRIVYTVTDLTKEIAGVRAAVIWIRDYSNNKLQEAELSFYAQDDDGNVWYLGEYPEVYENGELVEAPAWIPGFKGASAGFAMKAHPQPGMPSYSQGLGPAVGWADRAQVVAAGMTTCVPAGCYDNVLVTEETSQIEPDAFQVKSYAPGVGNIKVTWRGADALKETLELTARTELSPEEMADTRTQALELEKRAYRLSKEVYALTPVSQHPAGVPAITVDASLPPPVELPAPVASVGDSVPDVLAYASDVPQSGLLQLQFLNDPASPGNKLIGLPNKGNELLAPPRDNPHVALNLEVRSGIPYRCWIHMKVGTPLRRSTANLIRVQLSDAYDAYNNQILQPGTASYLTAQGPAGQGWAWVGCNLEEPASTGTLIYFHRDGEITARVQFGMEGVGFDQFLLSPATYLANAPSALVVEKLELATGAPGVTVDASLPPPADLAELPAPVEAVGASAADVLAYASDVPDSGLFQLRFLNDPASPDAKFIGLPNNGNELLAPPRDNPHVVVNLEVQSGIPYRCWIHMKVGNALRRSTANVIRVQLSEALDAYGNQILQPGTASYLTARGPIQQGWTWVPCNLEGAASIGSLVYFHRDGEIAARLQFGMEGVGFDQLLLSPAAYLAQPPATSVLEKSG